MVCRYPFCMSCPSTFAEGKNPYAFRTEGEVVGQRVISVYLVRSGGLTAQPNLNVQP